MAETRGPLDKLTDLLKDKLAEVIGTLSPEPDPIPIPIRNDPLRDRR
jgi:hypothetical protein